MLRYVRLYALISPVWWVHEFVRLLPDYTASYVHEFGRLLPDYTASYSRLRQSPQDTVIWTCSVPNNTIIYGKFLKHDAWHRAALANLKFFKRKYSQWLICVRASDASTPGGSAG